MQTHDFRCAYAGRSVLVTGHTGFKGSWLATWLARLGASTHGYSLDPPTCPSHYQLCETRSLLTTETHADVRDVDALVAAIERAEVDALFHLAAQSAVREGYRTPLETFDVNVMGMASVLEAVRLAGRPMVVVLVTTDKVYENVEQTVGYREDDPLGGFDPYSASKGAAEIVAASYRRSYFPPERFEQHGVRVATARAGNVIGGGDFKRDALIVDTMQALAANRPVAVRNPTSVRPWQHVLDCLCGYLTLGAALRSDDAGDLDGSFNFGPLPGGDLPVAELVRRVIETWGQGGWMDASDPTAPHETCLLRLAIDKALWTLKWRPVWDIDEAIVATTQWYRALLDCPSAVSLRALTERQIQDFETSAFSAGAFGSASSHEGEVSSDSVLPGDATITLPLPAAKPAKSA